MCVSSYKKSSNRTDVISPGFLFRSLAAAEPAPCWQAPLRHYAPCVGLSACRDMKRCWWRRCEACSDLTPSATEGGLAPTPALPQWGGELNRCILHIDATSISSYPRTRAIRRKARSGAIGACHQGAGSAAASERNRKPGEMTSVRMLLFL